MKTKLVHLFIKLRSNFWVIPVFSIVVAIAAASLALLFDHRHSERILNSAPWLKQISPDGTTSLLGTVANSVLTLAGVTFSGTLVALTLASSQFGPRLLRNFIHANTTQLTLGVLLATYVYCLIVMRSVRSGEFEFVPHVATFGGFFLTLLSLGLFISFIQHVVASIQAEKVAAEVYGELCRSIDRFFGDEGEAEEDEERERGREKEEWDDLDGENVLIARSDGYLQALNIEDLVTLAAEQDLRCRTLVKPGSFIVEGGRLLAWNAGEELAEEDRDRFRACFLMGPQRTAEQDLEYCVRQLVEIVLRALSSGINDPFTAVNCIDFLGGALVKAAGKKLPKDEFRDQNDVPRVRIRPETFTSFLDAACNQIRQASSSKPEVSIRMLEMLTEVGRHCRPQQQRDAVLQQADLIVGVACDHAPTSADADAIRQRHEELKKQLCRA